MPDEASPRRSSASGAPASQDNALLVRVTAAVPAPDYGTFKTYKQSVAGLGAAPAAQPAGFFTFCAGLSGFW
ncbi:hypothetical protein C3450_04020 [Escherichia coli]|nr:hypothetical protein C3450_04020 [Escherichia coli]